ncbi:hypothetical protein [Acetobacter senegalensis]|uniref:hypothetical protein n=1 Tax=Acetobacter senegalensis TaxID=446692 RepID=UPI00186B5B0C|nr:hypothetical protein [Acetobacter senegalensis]
MARQTFAEQRRKTCHRGKNPPATADRLHLLQEASWNLSAISYCIASVGRDLAGKPNEPGAMDAAGQALEWLADEMQRRCVAIDEGLS